MTAERRSTADLQRFLSDRAGVPYPEYIEDVLATTARVRQRPAWRFPERWLPFIDTLRERAFVLRQPWRVIAIAVVLLLLIAATALIIGTRQPKLPMPYGLAGNGLVAFETGGDIFTADSVSGEARAVVSDSAADSGPRFSLDGTKILFARDAGDRRVQLYTVRLDGSQLTLITPDPLDLAPADLGRAWERYEFSPDGTTVLIATSNGGVPSIAIAATDGSGVRLLDVNMAATEPSYRPPNGREVLFVAGTLTGRGLFSVDLSTGIVRTILTVPPSFELAGASWSPDGSRIAYWSWNNAASTTTSQTHVVAADGTGDTELPSPAGAVWNAQATWSNDGTRLFILRGYTGDFSDVRGFVIPADGSGPGVEVAAAGTVDNACCGAWLWSPDDSTLFGRIASSGSTPSRQLVIDLATRQVTSPPWLATSDPTWQRLAP